MIISNFPTKTASNYNDLTAGTGIIIKDNAIYSTLPSVAITQEEYDALTDEQKNSDVLYIITGDGLPKDGQSAYEIAVKNGFQGTETEWLASLRGQCGEIGPEGPSGKDATINGTNTINIQAGDNVTIEQSGNILTISAIDGGSSGSAGEAYSTQEQVIGTWIDGKPLYRRVFQGAEIDIAGWGNEYGIGSAYTLSGGAIEGISKVVRLYGVFHYADAAQYALPLMEYRTATEYALASLCYDSYGGVMVNTFAVGEIQYSGTCTAVMEYTKTTD